LNIKQVFVQLTDESLIISKRWCGWKWTWEKW